MSAYRPMRIACRSAFTLIELLSVMAILAILVGMMAIAFSGRRDAAKADRARADLHVIQQGLEAYRARFGDYPRAQSVGEELSPAMDPNAYLLNALMGRFGPAGHATAGVSPMLNHGLLQLKSPQVPLAGVISNNWIIDPWGNAYTYAYPPAQGEERYGYFLFSHGPDGVAGNADDVHAR